MVKTISNASSDPVIYAHGFAWLPYQQTNYLERIVGVRTVRDGLFRKGALSQGQITLNGSGCVDSFDSTNPS